MSDTKLERFYIAGSGIHRVYQKSGSFVDADVAEALYEALDAFEQAADLWLPAKCGSLEHVGEVKALHSLREKMLAALAKARGES